MNNITICLYGQHWASLRNCKNNVLVHLDVAILGPGSILDMAGNSSGATLKEVHALHDKAATQQRSNRYLSANLFACQDRLHRGLTYVSFSHPLWVCGEILHRYNLGVPQVTLLVQSRNTLSFQCW